MKPGISTSDKKPYTILGAGQLVSSVWKTGDERRGWHYRFNIYRMNEGSGHVAQKLRPTDVRDLVKLAQVLAAVLADDGCLPADQRQTLAKLALQLDSLNHPAR